MSRTLEKALLYVGILAAGIAAPLLFPAFTLQFTVLWVMILFALTWDILGGQMGYNSLGNIVFFGAGMYICAVVQPKTTEMRVAPKAAATIPSAKPLKYCSAVNSTFTAPKEAVYWATS